MKFRLIPLLLILALPLLFSCKKRSSEVKKDEKDRSKKSDSPHGHGEKLPKITLNEGKKWEADEVTRTIIKDMKKLVATVKEKENPSLKEINQLGRNLEDKFREMLQKCTMKGPAHKQLHNYLLHLRSQIKMMKKEKLPEAQKGFETVQKVLGKFDQFFK